MKPGRGEIRPTSSRVRAAVFSMLGPDGVRDLRALDLYAGTGAFGIEALSRGAERAEFIELDERRCLEIRLALEMLGYGQAAKVHHGDAVKALERLDGKFDLIFADPPYESDPFATLTGGLERLGLLATGVWVFLEHSSRRELPDTFAGLRLKSRRKYGDSAVSVYRPAGCLTEDR